MHVDAQRDRRYVVWSVSATGGHCAKPVLCARRKLCDLLTTLDKKASAPTYPRSIHQKTSRSDPLSDAASQLGCCRKETTTCPSSQILNLHTINQNYSCNWEVPVSSAKCGGAANGFSGTPSWQICRGSCLPLVPVPFQSCRSAHASPGRTMILRFGGIFRRPRCKRGHPKTPDEHHQRQIRIRTPEAQTL